jgi:hypothetical protein
MYTLRASIDHCSRHKNILMCFYCALTRKSEGTRIENPKVVNGFLVYSLELPRRIERVASQLGANDKLSHGQFKRHVLNLSCSLLTGILRSRTTGGRKTLSEVLHHHRLYISQSHGP